MPRRSIVDIDKVRKLVSQTNIFDSQGKLFGPTNECWHKIATECGNISSNYVYTIVKLNRFNVLNISPLSCTSSSTSSASDKCSELEEDKSGPDHLTFMMNFERRMWEELVVQVEHFDSKLGTRTYKTLKPNYWTDLFYTKFFEATRLPCTLIFNKNKITEFGLYYLKFYAKCSTCHSSLTGILNEMPNWENSDCVSVECSYDGKFKNCHSTRKRPVRGIRRKVYADKLLDKKMAASFLRKETAKDLMKFGETEPSHLPTLNALRLIKSRERRKSFIHENPIISLSLLKQISPYKDIVRDIGLDKFFVHYWSKTELNCYRMFTRQNRIPTVSIDATGSVVKKVKLLSGKESQMIFLYEVVVKDKHNKLHYPVSHMLSSTHTTNAISHWLCGWIGSGIRQKPKVIVTDLSLALMHAVTRSFTQYTNLWAYIRTCSCLLLNHDIQQFKDIFLPTSCIRNDYNHIMHNFSKWNAIKTASKNAKQFYMRSLALIVTTPSYESVKKLIEYFFLAVICRENGYYCVAAKEELKRRIAGQTELDTCENIDWEPIPEEDGAEDEDKEETTMEQEIQELYNKAVTAAQSIRNRSDEDNAFYAPSIAHELRKLCKLLPTWSAIMVPVFQYGEVIESTAPSEGCFNEVKNRIFQHETLPDRVDEFVRIHCDAIIGGINLIKACEAYQKRSVELVSPPKEDEYFTMSDPHICKTPSPTLQEICPEQVEENWRGMADKIKPIKKRKSYRDMDPSILYVPEKRKSIKKIVGLLKNGNCDTLGTVKIEGKYFTLLNTCAFDTVAQILFVSYADSIEYATFVDSAEKEFFQLISKGIRDGITLQTYKRRAAVLLQNEIGKLTPLQENHVEMNCATTSYYLLSKLLAKDPSLEELVHCQQCVYENIRSFPTILLNLPTDTMALFNDTLIQRCSPPLNKECPSCKSPVQVLYHFNRHLFLELSSVILKGQTKNIGEVKVQLNEIPVTITPPGQSFIYKLRGVISFIAPPVKSMSAIGHYIAYCYRFERKAREVHDDLRSEIRSAPSSTLIPICRFLVYTI